MLRILNRLYVYSIPVISRHAVPSTNVSHLTTNFAISPSRRHLSSSSVVLQKKKMIQVTFINRDGVPLTVKAKIGDTLLDAAVNNDVDLEGFGACEGTLSCSTCHVILKKEDFDKLPDKPSDEELDMLDLAYGLTDTSRLGCQITLTENMDGIVVTVPAQVADARNN